MSGAFDWGALMRVGLRGLGLRPAEFWDLTPAELQMLLGSGVGETPMLSNGLAALMAGLP